MRSPVPMSAMDKAILAERGCAVRQFDGLPGVYFMVIGHEANGPVHRIELGDGSLIRTDTGIRLGSWLSAVGASYGPALDEPFDFYPEDGHAVLVPAGAGSSLFMVFIADSGDRVVWIRLGYRAEVTASEGCS